jgi:SET domain-containing protein
VYFAKDNNVWCDVTKCKEEKKTPKEATMQIFHDGIIQESTMFPVSHYIKLYGRFNLTGEMGVSPTFPPIL